MGSRRWMPLLVMALVMAAACEETPATRDAAAPVDARADVPISPPDTADTADTAVPDAGTPDAVADTTDADRAEADTARDLPSDPIPNESSTTQLAASRSTWLARKAREGADYEYSSDWASFTGYRSRTRIEVRGDKVVKRSYEATNRDGGVERSWIEEGAAIGTNSGAVPALTLDVVYDRCASEVLSKDPNANRITLGFDRDGILAICIFRPINCADDCNQGHIISTLTFLD